MREGEFKFGAGPAHARASDPETSHAAAEDICGAKANRMEKLVLAVLVQNPGGLTNHEIAQRTGLPWNTASPRIRPLVRKGLLVDSGERRAGPTKKKCVVWKAV